MAQHNQPTIMAEIKIEGNKEDYQLTQSVKYLEIGLVGGLGIMANTQIEFYYDDITLLFENSQTLFKFADEARGASREELIQLFKQYKFDDKFLRILMKVTEIEIGLLKSVFLIYYWIEASLHDDLSVKKIIYNDFVIDTTNEVGAQKDIYFLDAGYNSDENKDSIQKLMELNLLVSLTVTTNTDKKLKSYFIPLVKPGISRKWFASAPSDIKGTKTHNLWKNILNDRDNRISNWIKNRF